MIFLSEIAIREFKRRLAAADDTSYAIRFGLKPGGCAGTKVFVEITSDHGDDDQVFEQGGLRILCDPISLTSLNGLKVDFVEALVGGGFQYDNPNAALICACGQSFDTE